MDKVHNYSVFGLNIYSDVVLPELISGHSNGQDIVNIKQCKVSKPASDLEHTVYQNFQIFNKEFFYLELQDQARFKVVYNKKAVNIFMEVLDFESFAIIKSWLFGSVLTAALQMHNRFALHSSAVLYKEQLFLFCGHSGIGKSTIASQLHSRGFPIFSDDKCVLKLDKVSNKLWAYPSLKITRLWKNSKEAISNDSFLHQASKVAHKAEKYQFLIKDENVIKVAKEVNSIYRIHNGPEISTLQIIKPTGIHKIKQLRKQTHRLNYVQGLNKQQIHWNHMEAITQNVPYFVINRPHLTTIQDFADFVTDEIILKS